jgi:hypothetical protein
VADAIEPLWVVAEVFGVGSAGTLAAAGTQQVSSAQSLGAVETGPVLPQSMLIGIAATAGPLGWLQQSIVRWLPQAPWPQAFSVKAG